MKNSSQIILALITSLGFFGCIFWMLHIGFPAENKDQLNQLIGVLGTIWTLQMNYFFGSSSGSVAKDETISTIAQAAPVVGTAAIIPAKDVSVKAEGDVMVTTKENAS